MAIQLLINCKLRRSQSSLHTARRCIPNLPTYISNDHEHQNGTINSSLVGVIIGDWKFYNHQGLCFNSKRSIRVGIQILSLKIFILDIDLAKLIIIIVILREEAFRNVGVYHLSFILSGKNQSTDARPNPI
ncbi:hypothetical protein H8356DRAFT_1350345 [Neocallimastix lanati (nom. inval.)]|nr:hypothetical protein H8356DRAFT_1350345 [Neocallimastix sp. JGI-2020a]